MYAYTNKVEKKEQQCQIEGKGRNNLITRMQLDRGTYTLTGQILSQNFQENWKKMQRHTCYNEMTGWKPITLRKI